MADAPGAHHPSKAWYLVPLFFGILGGLIGYIAIKDDDRKMAKNLIIFSLVMQLALVGLLVALAYVPLSPVGYFGLVTF